MTDGWRCPGCFRYYAPTVSVCPTCKPVDFGTSTPVQTYNVWQCGSCGGQMQWHEDHVCRPATLITIKGGHS